MRSNKTLLKEHTSKYGILFDLFRRSSNESDVIINRIRGEIEQIDGRSKSLLDIGASDGLLIQKLSPYFERIVAIERNKDDIYALDALGMDTHHCLWEDFHSKERFDTIIASHMIYYLDDRNYVGECKRMQEYLKPEGKAFIIANAHQNDYANLMDTFYPIVHNGENPFPKTNGLEKKLKRKGIPCEADILTFSVDFMNPNHFLSLCGFFLGYEPQIFHELDENLKQYYKNNLRPYGNGKQKKMNVDINFLKIQNPSFKEDNER